MYSKKQLDKFKDVIIEKPTCFGVNVHLNNNVKIKELTVLGQQVTIGEDTTIDKSVLWDEIKIGSGCYISESIICNNCISPGGSRHA